MKKHCSEQPQESRQVFARGISYKNLQVLIEVMRAKYGDEADNMTLVEIKARHPELIAQMDEGREAIGLDLSDREMVEVEHRLEVGTTIRDARRQVISAKGRAKVV